MNNKRRKAHGNTLLHSCNAKGVQVVGPLLFDHRIVLEHTNINIDKEKSKREASRQGHQILVKRFEKT